MKTFTIIIISIISLLLLLSLTGFIYIKANSQSSLSYDELSEYAYDTLVLDNGMNVNYGIDGKDNVQTILLVHGGFDSLDGWNDWIPTLSNEYKVVSLDLPGHGLTDPLPDRNYTRYEASKFLKAFADKLELEDIIIVGHSMGGEYSIQYTIDNPENVKGLVIVAAGGYLDDAATVETEQELLKLANSPFAPLFYNFGTEEDIKEAFHEYLQLDINKYSDIFNRLNNLSRYEKHRDTSLMMIKSMYSNPHNIIGLDTITVPTLILWGDQDTIALPQHAYRFDEDIADTELIIYSGVAHGLQIETKEKGALDIIDFIKRKLN